MALLKPPHNLILYSTILQVFSFLAVTLTRLLIFDIITGTQLVLHTHPRANGYLMLSEGKKKPEKPFFVKVSPKLNIIRA